jgi:predicted HTH transcriptional regulator
MFGQEWLITRTYPNYFIDYREVMDDSVRWEDRLTSQDGRWSGNVYDAFYRIYNKITPALKAPFKTDGLYRQNETPAHEAIREALVNTFTNADYSVEGGVKITHSTDALIFENPGGFRVGIEDALTGGISNPRNKTLMKMFSLIDLSERAGSGIPNMVANWKESGYAAPELSESVDPERSIVLLPLAPSENKSNKTYKTSSQKSNKSYEDAALDLILQNGCVTTKMLADYTGVTTVTARKTLKRLADAGRLHWVGNSKSDPSQHYVL